MPPTFPPGDPTPGTRIGRFRIVEQLGRGGMGVVYRAVEENLGREVALKVISPQFAHDPEFRERFTREARAQASLESAHVVAVYAHGEEDGHLYLASQLIPGGDLGQLIRAEGVPSLIEGLEIIEQVGSGLADAHDAGLVHRDIKPGNVLVRRRPGVVRAYLADFGIARKLDAAATRFGSSDVGTPSFMAPELHTGAAAGIATDIYALGCLLWVTLTGQPPYRGGSDYQLVAAHLHEPIPQLSGSSAMVNATNRILRTSMAKDPAARYRRTGEMTADLQAALRLPDVPGSAVPAAGAGTALRPLPTGDPSHPPTPTQAPANPPANPPATPAYFAAPPTGRRTSAGKRWALLAVAAVVAIGAGGVAAVVVDDGAVEGAVEGEPTVDTFLDLEPKEMVRASQKDMAVVESARIQGEFASEDTVVAVDVVSTSRGDCKGTMTDQSSGGVAELLRVDGVAYIRADEKYWNATTGEGTGEQVLSLIGERWVLDESLTTTTEVFCDLDELLERDGREDARARVLDTIGVGDEESVRIEQAEGGNREVLTIRVSDPHHIVRIDESDTDYFEFSDLDLVLEVRPPGPDQIFDLDEYVKNAGKAAKP